MVVKQSRYTFIRTSDNMGYMYNQKTKLERLYNETGVEYMKTLSRSTQCVKSIVENSLLPLYYDASFEQIYEDFVSFLKDLSHYGFVFIGNNEDELKSNEREFSQNWNNNLFVNSLHDEHAIINKSTQETILDLTGERPYLMSLQFELTSKCNERCIHCYIPNSKKDKGIDLPFNLFKKVLDEFAEMGGLQVSLSGGEIFMHKEINNIIKYCREKDMQIVLLSNLLSFDNKNLETIKDANVSMIQVSLYSMKEDIHDKITTIKNSYKKTRETLELLVKNDIPVMISCPIMKANSKSYHDILEYAHSLGIKAQTDFILMGKEDMDTENLVQRLDLSETEGVIREILHNEGVDSVDKIKDQSPKELFPLKLSQPICAAGRTNICVNANGDVTPCNGWQGLKAGNLYHSSLNEIWESSKVLYNLRKITRGSFKECIACEAKDFCSLCLARNYNESNGNHLKINRQLCEISFLNKRIYEEMIGM